MIARSKNEAQVAPGDGPPRRKPNTQGWRTAVGGSVGATIVGFVLCNGAVVLATLGLGSAGLLSAMHSTAPILWSGAIVLLVLAGALWLRSRRRRILEQTNPRTLGGHK